VQESAADEHYIQTVELQDRHSIFETLEKVPAGQFDTQLLLRRNKPEQERQAV